MSLQLNTTTAGQGYALVIDTETGGLDERIHPLLSIAAVIADKDLEMLDGFEVFLIPPKGTVLEVPVEQHMFTPPMVKRTISYYLDVHTGARLPTLPPEAPLITGVAAEVNKFIVGTPSNPKVWDLESYKDWMMAGLSLEHAEKTFQTFVRQAFTRKPVGMAHNAPFDQKFVERYMPNLYADIHPVWFDTLATLRSYYKNSGMSQSAKTAGIKLSAKLVDGAKLAGYDLKNAHEALADCIACLKLAKWLKAQGTTPAPLPSQG